MSHKASNNRVERPPVVVVMGHVDHGKTMLLDTIRKTNVVAKEAGGITQSIGAYEIVHNGKNITFIDTPGHEAFSKMRERGAAVADLAILVVAADDGVKAQTKEALSQILASKTPYIVAINKIDKPSANIDRTKRELLENEVLLEGMGGNVSYQELSAKSGEGVSDLLDLILIAAELEGFTYDAGAPARGFIIEAKTDPKRGITASIVMRDGTLRKGDEIATPTAAARVRIMENFMGKQVTEVVPSTPVLVVGFSSLPLVGEEFVFGATATAPVRQRIAVAPEKKENAINIIIRSDSLGALEALVELAKRVEKNDYSAQVVDAAVGEVTNNDVNAAVASGAIILAFNVGINKSSELLAKDNGVTILSSPIIYKLMEELEEVLERTIPKRQLGEARILRIFKKVDNGFIVGGKVLTGHIKNGAIVELWRGENKVGEGTILNLQSGRKDTETVEAGNEFGMVIEGRNVFENDLLKYFES